MRADLSPCGLHAPPASASPQVPLKEMGAFEGADAGKLLAEVKGMVKADRVSERGAVRIRASQTETCREPVTHVTLSGITRDVYTVASRPTGPYVSVESGDILAKTAGSDGQEANRRTDQHEPTENNKRTKITETRPSLTPVLLPEEKVGRRSQRSAEQMDRDRANQTRYQPKFQK